MPKSLPLRRFSILVCLTALSAVSVPQTSRAEMVLSQVGTTLTFTITEGAYTTEFSGSNSLAWGLSSGLQLDSTPDGAFDELGGGSYGFIGSGSPTINIYYSGTNQIQGIMFSDGDGLTSHTIVGGSMTLTDPFLAGLTLPAGPMALTRGSFSGVNGDMTLLSVPEPSSLLLLGLVVFGAIGFRTRRKSD